MNKLEMILSSRRSAIAKRKRQCSIKLLERSPYFQSKTVSMCKHLRSKRRIGIIAEVKKRSPSHGDLKPNIAVADLSVEYVQAGASALSVLTEPDFFGGSNTDLENARLYNYCPILRKDFILDEYQVIESKALGADIILLIAAALNPHELKKLARLAHLLGMEVLIEVHNKADIINTDLALADVIGVNNRNLSTFECSLETSYSLRDALPITSITISESGIKTAADLHHLKQAGYDGFLIGGSFMSTHNPAQACRDLIAQYKRNYPGNIDS